MNSLTKCLFQLYGEQLKDAVPITEDEFDDLCTHPFLCQSLLYMIEESLDRIREKYTDYPATNIFCLKQKYLYELTLMTELYMSDIRELAGVVSHYDIQDIMTEVAYHIDRPEVGKFMLHQLLKKQNVDRIELFWKFTSLLILDLQHYNKELETYTC